MGNENEVGKVMDMNGHIVDLGEVTDKEPEEKIISVENFDLDRFVMGLAQTPRSETPEIAVGFVNDDGTQWLDYVTITMNALEAVRDWMGWKMFESGEKRRELCWKRKATDTHPALQVVLAIEIKEPQEEVAG